MPTKKTRTTGKRVVTKTKENTFRNKGGVERYKSTRTKSVTSPRKKKKTTSLTGSSYRNADGIYRSSDTIGSSKKVKTPRKSVSKSYYSKGIDGEYTTVARRTDRKGNKYSYSIDNPSRNSLGVSKKTKETKKILKSKGSKSRTSYNWTPSGGGSNTSSSSYKYKKNKKTGKSKLVQKSSSYRNGNKTSTKKVYKNGKLVRSKTIK